MLLFSVSSCKSDQSASGISNVTIPKFTDLALVSVTVSPYMDIVDKASMSRPLPIYDKNEFLPESNSRNRYGDYSMPMAGNMLYLKHYVDALLTVFNEKLPGNVIDSNVVLSDPVVRQLPSRMLDCK